MSVRTYVESARESAENTAESIAPNPQNLAGDTRGENMMQNGVQLAVGILVVGLLTAYLLPIGINEINAVNATGWGTGTESLFFLLPVFFVLAIMLFVVNKAVN